MSCLFWALLYILLGYIPKKGGTLNPKFLNRIHGAGGDPSLKSILTLGLKADTSATTFYFAPSMEYLPWAIRIPRCAPLETLNPEL